MVACFAAGLNLDNIVADDTTKYALFLVLQIFFRFDTFFNRIENHVQEKHYIVKHAHTEDLKKNANYKSYVQLRRPI